MCCRPSVRRSKCCATTRTSIEEAGGEVLFECKQEECGGDAERSSSRRRRRYEPDAVFLPRERPEGRSLLERRLRADRRHQRPALLLGQGAAVDGGDAYVTVQTYTLIDDLYCKELNGRTIARRPCAGAEAARQEDGGGRGRGDGRFDSTARQHLALRHLLRHRQGRHQAGIRADADGDREAAHGRSRNLPSSSSAIPTTRARSTTISICRRGARRR